MDDIINNAKNASVEHMLCVSIDLESHGDVLATAIKYPEVSASVGVHPNCSSKNMEPSVEQLIDIASNDDIVAIGETGLDFFYEGFDGERQIRQFKTHINAALEVKKPLIIHCRDASSSLIPLLKSQNAEQVGGVMHCFVDDWDVALAAMDLGFFISFSGIVTFKNAGKLRLVAEKMPIEKILIETDSPWLAPVPERGKQNQPAFVAHTARFLSDLRNESLLDFSRETTRNFYSLFNLVAK